MSGRSVFSQPAASSGGNGWPANGSAAFGRRICNAISVATANSKRITSGQVPEFPSHVRGGQGRGRLVALLPTSSLALDPRLSTP